MMVALPSVGSAILGSAITTIAGFLALLLAAMPMMQNLGLTLAMGIFFCLMAVLFVSPVLILLEEKLFVRLENRRKTKGE